jgi:HlyD family secretion protein
MKKLLPVLLLAVIIAAAVIFLNRSRPAEAEGAYSGYAEGELVYVASPIGGEVQTLAVQRGDQAKKGAPLFLLEREEEKAARLEAEETLRESRTRLDKANLDYNRAKSLRDKRVTSPEDFDTAQQTLLAAQHNTAARQRGLEQADWRYRQKEKTAPVSGLIYDTYYRPGEWVPPGTPVVSVLPPEYLKARFFVPEPDLGKFTIGAPVEIHLDGLPAPLPGRVSFVSPNAEYTLPIIYSRENRDKLVFLVEASLAPEHAARLHPGAPLEVHLNPQSPISNLRTPISQ